MPVEIRIAQRKNAAKAIILARVNQNSVSPKTLTPKRAKPKNKNLKNVRSIR